MPWTAESSRAWKEKNRERYLADARNKRAAILAGPDAEKFRERERESARRRRAANVDAVRARERRNYAKNREKRCAAQKTPEARARARGYRQKNNARYREKDRANRIKNRESRKNTWLLWKYGIGLEQYNAMLAAQSGGCKICLGPPNQKKPLVVDHCHATGVIRGLLCSRCNRCLGQMHDKPNFLRAAADYIEAGRNGNPIIYRVGLPPPERRPRTYHRE